jgi:hypothetical protein
MDYLLKQIFLEPQGFAELHPAEFLVVLVHKPFGDTKHFGHFFCG